MKKYIFGLILVSSLSAFAGYDCDLKLAQSENLHSTIAQSKLSASDKDLKTIHIKDFFIEEKSKRKMIGLSIQSAIVGWSGEEEVTLAVFRRTAKKKSIDSVLISEKITVKGIESKTLWFDTYKLDVSCSLN